MLQCNPFIDRVARATAVRCDDVWVCSAIPIRRSRKIKNVDLPKGHLASATAITCMNTKSIDDGWWTTIPGLISQLRLIIRSV